MGFAWTWGQLEHCVFSIVVLGGVPVEIISGDKLG